VYVTVHLLIELAMNTLSLIGISLYPCYVFLCGRYFIAYRLYRLGYVYITFT